MSDKTLDYRTSNLSLDSIQEIQHNLDVIRTQLNKAHNTNIAINRVIPDILYRIFTFSVHSSVLPGTTALYISHVCTQWRKFALEWSNLWGFVDLSARSISNLFVQRSGKAPITLSWTTRYHLPLFDRPAPSSLNFYRASKLDFESCSNYILPRLESLILHLSYREFNGIQHVFKSCEPLRLRSLDIGLYTSFGGVNRADFDTQWPDIIRIDTKYLRELRIGGLELPWSQPPHDKLTHLSINQPAEIPKLTHLLTFLSHCPLLTDLELYLSDDNRSHPRSNGLDLPSTGNHEGLDFPCLTRLELGANGSGSYRLIRNFSTYVRFSGTERAGLSSFSLKYDYIPPNGGRPLDAEYAAPTVSPTFDIFESVPSGIFWHFTHHQYLCINFLRSNGLFCINTRPTSQPTQPHWQLQTQVQAQNRRGTLTSQPFPVHISGTGQPGRLFEHLPILKLTCSMSEVRHLVLISSAWEVLTSWNIDVPSTFPYLTTLELSDRRHPVYDCMETLNSLHFNLNTLILKRVRIASSADLLDVAARIKLQTLELGECQVDYEIITTLRARGITVIVSEEPVFAT